MTIVVNCEQGSPEWIQARTGVITASMFGIARKKVGCLTDQQGTYVAAILRGASEKEAKELAGYKVMPTSSGIQKALRGEPVGDWSDESKNYAFRLAIERISGYPLDEGFETYAMRRGHELEPMARAEHEMQSGLIVKHAGFVMTDDSAFGASADGLIDEDAGSEYKCFMNPERLRAFHIDNDASEVFEQVQGCLWVTGRKEWHLGMYCPALEPVGKQLWWKVFPRDEDYIEKLEADLVEFKRMVDAYEARLREQA